MTDLPRFVVELDDDARADLRAIARYIAEHQSPEIADRYLTSMLERIAALETLPHRGSTPKELERYPRRGFRQLVTGPHRIIYRIDGARVIIALVVDGRRDLQTIFAERLLSR